MLAGEGVGIFSGVGTSLAVRIGNKIVIALGLHLVASAFAWAAPLNTAYVPPVKLTFAATCRFASATKEVTSRPLVAQVTVWRRRAPSCMIECRPLVG